MIKKITLRGPVKTITIVNNNGEAFEKFINWLKEYNPANTLNYQNYPIASDNRIIACKIKARKLSLGLEPR